MDTITEAKIPTIIPVHKNFIPGQGFKIYGSIALGGSSFDISLQCGKDITVQGDVALEIVFNLETNNVSIHSKSEGIWERQQIIQNVPLKLGEKFEIVLICTSNEYQIYINGQKFAVVPQNILYQLITFIKLNGDVIIEKVSHEIDANASIAFGFGRGDGSLNNYDRHSNTVPLLVRPHDVNIPLDSSSESESKYSKWKPYITYGTIAVVILVITLCVVFIPKKKQETYDFD